MKKFSILMMIVVAFSLAGCNNGNEVSGRSLKSAYRSVNHIKSRLPTETRIEFEMSFWMIKDEMKNKSAFLDKVGGQTAEELIELGKTLYQKRKNEGYKNYDKFNNWDQMITHYTQERLDQTKHKKKHDPRNKDNNVVYNL